MKTLVDLHGGTVQVHSHGLGLGSEFVVRLPMAAAGDDAPGPAADKRDEGAAVPDRKKSAGAGFDAHVVKPVDPETLMKLLADLPPRYRVVP